MGSEPTLATTVDERACRGYEAAWHAGRPECIESYLPNRDQIVFLPTLEELVHIELKLRWKAWQGQPAASRGAKPDLIEDYLERFADLNQPTILLRLVQEEFELRYHFGDGPTREEYRRRFPLLVVTGDEITLDQAPGAETSRPEIPGCEILHELGRGGMGVVYKARQQSLNRLVAAKTILTGLAAGSEDLVRFLAEAEAVARLQHPHIVQIYELGRSGGRPYFLMEFLEGGTLSARLREIGPFPSRQAAQIVETLARAVAFAHQHGIVHRDLKPANVLLTRAGEPKISDFGLAKHLQAGPGLTQTGAILGTPSYMAPEQAVGDSEAIGPRTDVYALGAILYELLTGRPPFQAASVMETLDQVRRQEPVSPRRLQPGLDRDLETICLRCLHKEPHRRYASAVHLAEDLHRYLSHEPIVARRVGWTGRLARWCRRQPAMAATIFLALTGMLTVGGIGLWQVLEERSRYRDERDKATQQRDRAEVNLYRSLVSDARAQLKARETGWWWQSMDSLDKAARLKVVDRDPVELRELAIQCMGTEFPCLRLLHTWSAHDASVSELAIHRDGRLAASAAPNGTVRVWSLPDGKLVAQLASHKGPVTGMDFSPDLLGACSADGRVHLWKIDEIGAHAAAPTSLAPSMIHPLQAGSLHGLAFGPKGAWLAVGCKDHAVRMLSLHSQGPLQVKILEGHQQPVVGVCASRDGRFLASAAKDQTMRIWDPETGKCTQTWEVGHVPHRPSFASHGWLVAWSHREGYGIVTNSAHKNEPGGLNQIHAAPVSGVFIDRWGRHLTASEDGSIKLWNRYATRANYVEWAQATGDFGAVHSLALSADQRYVLAGHHDGTIRLWELVEPPQRAVLLHQSQQSAFIGGQRRLVDGRAIVDFSQGIPGAYDVYDLDFLALHAGRPNPKPTNHQTTVWGVAASPDARWVATVSHDETAKLWHADTMTLARTLTGHRSIVWSAAFAPDSKTFATGGTHIIIWNTASDKPVHELHGHTRMVSALAYHPRRQLLASASYDGTVLFWDTSQGKCLGQLACMPAPLHTLAFHPGGRWLAVGGADHKVALFDLDQIDVSQLPKPGAGQGLAPHKELSGHAGPVRAVAFHPDGGLLATGSEQGVILLWDGHTFARLVKMQGGQGQIRSLEFSRDGGLLASTAYLTHTIVWDLEALRKQLRDMDLDW